MSTTPSSNSPFCLATRTFSSRMAMKWSKTLFCILTHMPSSRLRKPLTLPLSSVLMPTEATASSASSRYSFHRACSSSFALSPSARRTYGGGGRVDEKSGLLSSSMSSSYAFLPHLVSTSNIERSDASAARRSPLVMAPSCCSRLATVDAKRRSPPQAVMNSWYSGPWIWLERCVRPHCWMHWSADHGSSSVMCSRLRVFGTRRSACSEMPDEAASEMMATSLRPSMKAFFSARLMRSIATIRPVSESTSFAFRFW
mmetsp:Transcript_21340/g.62938  ORF Transcript_21340/g.62938 Transcript_21340/m.62938 type:complete len:256 (-) Transcript_21340:1011-1778(-)